MAENGTKTHSLTLKASAKINLFLHVVGKRDDGYHDLVTWMQKIDLNDLLEVEFTKQRGIRFTCSDPALPCDESNLVVQAARRYFSYSKHKNEYGLNIHLEKKIPVAAGLGGGSSDAGTLLKGLNRFFDNEFSETELISLSSPLGADVPFFATDMESVIARGIGDIMVPVTPCDNWTVILVNPGVSVSTASVFKKFTLTRKQKNSTLTGSQNIDVLRENLSKLENDLESVTISLHPVISEIKTELVTLGAEKALMSGSGPTVFGLFRNSSGEQQKDFGKIVKILRSKFGDKVFTAK